MGRDKALLESDGVPLYRALAERMAEFAEPVFIAPGIPGKWGASTFDEVTDVVADAGPLAGIAAALRATPGDTLAVVAADMPFAAPSIFQLLDRLRTGEQAVVPVTSSGLQPLHALYSTSALPVIEEALMGGHYRLGDLLDELDVREVAESEWRVADPSGRFATNLNRPEDLALLRIS